MYALKPFGLWPQGGKIGDKINRTIAAASVSHDHCFVGTTSNLVFEPQCAESYTRHRAQRDRTYTAAGYVPCRKAWGKLSRLAVVESLFQERGGSKFFFFVKSSGGLIKNKA